MPAVAGTRWRSPPGPAATRRASAARLPRRFHGQRRHERVPLRQAEPSRATVTRRRPHTQTPRARISGLGVGAWPGCRSGSRSTLVVGPSKLRLCRAKRPDLVFWLDINEESRTTPTTSTFQSRRRGSARYPSIWPRFELWRPTRRCLRLGSRGTAHASRAFSTGSGPSDPPRHSGLSLGETRGGAFGTRAKRRAVTCLNCSAAARRRSSAPSASFAGSRPS